MSVYDFIGTVILVTASGALAPGPLFFGTLVQGSKGGLRSGLSCAFGHMLVEFPLVLALAFGLLAAASQPAIKGLVGLVGGLALIGFGVFQIRETMKMRPNPNELPKPRMLPASSILMGILLTGLNPYFILWWLTIGSVLIVQALAFAAILGVLLMYVAHVWMDYAFLGSLGYFAKKGKTIVGSKYYRAILIVFALILIYYGATFVFAALSQ